MDASGAQTLENGHSEREKLCKFVQVPLQVPQNFAHEKAAQLCYDGTGRKSETKGKISCAGTTERVIQQKVIKKATH